MSSAPTSATWRYAQRYLEVCREVHRLLPKEEVWPLLRRYAAQARSDVAGVERAWAREKHRRGVGEDMHG